MTYFPLVSIAIPAYNCDRFIRMCLRSISMQTYKNYEIVIVDDCSTDFTLEVIHNAVVSFKLEDKTKLFKHSVNCGCGRTEKHAIELGTGELVIILDSDDALATRDAIELLVKAHQENPDASLVYSDFYNCDENLKTQKLKKCSPLKESQSYLGQFRGGKYIDSGVYISHVKCFKRSFYNKTEGVDPTLLKSVDKDLILKLEEVGKLVHLPIALYYHRIHKESISSSFKGRSKEERHDIEKSRVKMLEKARDRRMKKS